MNTIAVDAMGGDSAPIDIVKGAIKAKEQGVDVVLCGDKNLINPYLENHEIPVFDFPQVISMDEDPLRAIRNKKNASIVGCMQLLKDKKVQAVFSAGSTGATLISAISILGKHKGVIRPVIASVLPSLSGNTSLVLKLPDEGINVCFPSFKCIIASMDSDIYAVIKINSLFVPSSPFLFVSAKI